MKTIRNLLLCALCVFMTSQLQAQVPAAGTAGRTLYDNGTNWMASTNIFNNNANVGIGTATPSAKLEVVSNWFSLKGLTLTNRYDGSYFCPSPCVKQPYFTIRDFEINTSSSTTRLIFTDEAKLGIGTGTPLGKCHINGADALYIERGDVLGALNTKSKIGIDAAGTPGLLFQLSSDGGSTFTNTLHLANNGNVGIGTLTPTAKCHIDGTTLLYLERTNSSAMAGTKAKVLITAGAGAPGMAFYMSSDGGSAFTNTMYLANNGNVGIGITNPSQKLVVDGMVCAKEVRVSLNSDPCTWPDYVFSDDYKLTPLNELASYINTNSHLPNVPSADSVAESGIEVGQMQIILLKKVEELTLYMLEMQKQNEALKAEIAAIKSAKE